MNEPTTANAKHATPGLMQYVIRRELGRVRDREKLLAIINLIGVRYERVSELAGDYFARAEAACRIMRVKLDRCDEHWVARAIATIERDGGAERIGASGCNGKAITNICLEWLGMRGRAF